MILMVSVQNLEEALQALKGGADIVDVKNLQEALVGSANPWVVKEVRDAIPMERHASVTLGVVPNQVGTGRHGRLRRRPARGDLREGRLHEDGVRPRRRDAAGVAPGAGRHPDEAHRIALRRQPALRRPRPAPHDETLAKDGECDGFLIDTLTKDGRNLFDFISEPDLRDMVFEGKQLGMSTALSGHLKLDDLDELARINPDIVGVRGAVCSKGDRNDGVYWEAVAEFKRQLSLRETGEVAVHANVDRASMNGSSGGWLIIDGTGKTCAGILAALTEQVERDDKSFVEVIMPDVLNAYDIIVWAEKGGHTILTQRRDAEGSMRILVQP